MHFDNLVTFVGSHELICPECMNESGEYYKTKILETRTYIDEEVKQPVVRRRHICPNCNTQFYTIELLEH